MLLWRSISFWNYLTGLQTTLTVIIILVLPRPGECGTCSVGQVIRATFSKTHPWSGWSLAVSLCGSSLPIGPIALPALGRSWPGLKNPPRLWWNLNPNPSDPQSDMLTTTLWGLEYRKIKPDHTRHWLKNTTSSFTLLITVSVTLKYSSPCI